MSSRKFTCGQVKNKFGGVDILHISIDLAMFRLYFAYMSPYQVLEYHIEFLETFGGIWRSKEVFKVIIGRTTHRSDLSGATLYTSRATSLERPLKVARSFVSPLAATQRGRSRSLERLVGATSRGRCASYFCLNL
ncbi:hypothetical protein YC2023_122162 [Brassica napus]